MWVITTCSICSPSCGHTPPLPSLGTQTSFFVRSVYMYAHSQPFLALSRQSLKLFFFFFLSVSPYRITLCEAQFSNYHNLAQKSSELPTMFLVQTTSQSVVRGLQRAAVDLHHAPVRASQPQCSKRTTLLERYFSP